MKKMLFINYLIWAPESPNFKYKYELFSRWYSGGMLHLAAGTGEQRAGNFRFISYKYRTNRLLRLTGYLLFCLKTIWRLRSFDYIIAYDPSICGLIGLLARFVSGGKLVVEVNTDHLYAPKPPLPGIPRRLASAAKHALMRLVLSRADAIKFINKSIATNYRSVFKLDEQSQKQTTFFSFISTQVFSPKEGGEPYILLVGHPFDIKGVDVMIKAFQRISPLYPALKLKLIGHCPDKTPYVDLAKGNPNILFLPGQPYEKIVPEFENCLFYVSASRTEGIPRVVIEAMACGKAVIGSRAGGIPDVIQEGVTGLLFESENDAELAEKMRELLDSPERRREMGVAGRARTQEVFSPERYAQTYHDFLDSLG